MIEMSQWRSLRWVLLLVLALALVACAPAAAPAGEEAGAGDAGTEAPAAEAPAGGEAVPAITVLSNVQAADPIEFESTRLLVENMKQLGLDVEHRAMPWEQQADLVWYDRDNWQMTAWRMVGRPERMDPDEFIYNLFHSSLMKPTKL